VPAIAQGDHAIAPEAEQESCVWMRRGRSVREEGVDPRDRLVSLCETLRGIADLGCRYESGGLARFDSEITRLHVQPCAERRAQAHEDAADFAGDARVIGRKFCRMQVRPKRDELIAGGDGLVAPHHPHGEWPLLVGRKPSGALLCECSGFGPPPLGAVGTQHRTQNVLGRLCDARALEDIRGLARPARPLEDNGEVEGGRSI
jgi:hypothetical protein